MTCTKRAATATRCKPVAMGSETIPLAQRRNQNDSNPRFEQKLKGDNGDRIGRPERRETSNKKKNEPELADNDFDKSMEKKAKTADKLPPDTGGLQANTWRQIIQIVLIIYLKLQCPTT